MLSRDSTDTWQRRLKIINHVMHASSLQILAEGSIAEYELAGDFVIVKAIGALGINERVKHFKRPCDYLSATARDG